MRAPTRDRAAPAFRDAWRALRRAAAARGRLLVAVGLGTAAFSMQDILLEPYGGEILQPRRRRDDHADRAAGRRRARRASRSPRACSARGGDPYRLAALGALVGIVAFAAVIFADAAAIRRCCSASARR